MYKNTYQNHIIGKGIKYALLSALAALLMLSANTAQADTTHTPNPCLGVCKDVATTPGATTTANIRLVSKFDIAVTVTEGTAGSSSSPTPVAGIPPDKIYIEIGSSRFTCDTITSSTGKCTIKDVPAGNDGSYEVHVDQYLSTNIHDNIPFEVPGINFDSEPETRDLEIRLFKASICDQEDTVTARCSGDFLQPLQQCVRDDPDFPDGRLEFSEPGVSCARQLNRVCPGRRGTALGECAVNPSTGDAECVEGSCEAHDICSFSTPVNPGHINGFYEAGDTVVLNGSGFGTTGGEVRIGHVRIFVDPSDPRPEVFWTDTEISFIMPAEARRSLIGVRPKGYGFEVGIDENGETVFLLDAEGFLIEVYCYGGEIKITEYPPLELDLPEGETTFPVSVSGG